MNRSGDRHKGSTYRPSGAQKRKLSKEKTSKCEKELSKTRRMTDFIQTTSGSSVIEPDGNAELTQ
jgi:hypothetical protein